jgi:hypothetical protein
MSGSRTVAADEDRVAPARLPLAPAFISNKDWSRLSIFSRSLPSRPWADTAPGIKSSMLPSAKKIAKSRSMVLWWLEDDPRWALK